MKYISYMGTRPEIILFDRTIDHLEIARTLRIRRQSMLGAGLVHMRADDGAEEIDLPHYLPYCFGSSVRLQLASRLDEDTALLHRMLGMV